MKPMENQEKDLLFEAILSLKTLDECYRFFDDVCTIKEMQAIIQRFQVACQLDRDMNYAQITEQTGASSATICRVNKCLNYGDGGYRIVLDRLKKKGKLNRGRTAEK